jgi:hypothetical protein
VALGVGVASLDGASGAQLRSGALALLAGGALFALAKLTTKES